MSAKKKKTSGAEKPIVKTMRYQLIYLEGAGDYQNACREFWQIQKDTRAILNKTIQEACHWDYRSDKHKQETGEALSLKDETGAGSLNTYLYRIFTAQYPNMASNSLGAAVNKGKGKYDGSKKDIFIGTMSLPSYKSDQPILVKPEGIKFTHVPEKGNLVALTLFSKPYKKETGYENPIFSIRACDGTQKAILSRVLSGEYGLSESQLVYENKKWFLLLTYSLPAEKNALDPGKILGVDMGVKFAVYCCSAGEYGSLKIEGGEAIDRARKIEARWHSKQKQARYCGEGRIGHGTETRVAAVYQEGDALAAYRDTFNHRWSKAVVDYAVKNGYGTIQMEELKGIKEEKGFPRYLRHWTYYDLQKKIQYKAEAAGIAVEKVNPQYTSQRCSKCGYIARESRQSQEVFQCVACGEKMNADENAARNLSIRNIDKIIEKQLKKQGLREPEENSENA